MDDPTGRCTGTCDATGACKSKRGQTCETTAGGCVGGTTCADGYCCDRACAKTCEACDLPGSLGTCTPLAAGGQPRASRTACVGAGTPCAGTCNGTSADCSYSSAVCGTATCLTATSYQAAGVCRQGTCDVPPVATCENVCAVASGGCTGECQPTKLRCEPTTGVPQVCSSLGTWQNQAACQNGFTCTPATGTCTTCSSPKTACGNTCADVQTDAANCGACGHDCLGATCVLGKCQAVAVTGTLSASASLIGIDSNWLYFDQPSSNVLNSYDVYRVDKSHAGDNGTRVFTSSAEYDVPTGVIGSELFISDTSMTIWGFLVGSSTSKIALAKNGWPVPAWRASPNYYVQFDTDQTTNLNFAWYSQDNVEVGSHSESVITGATYGDFYQAGDRVVWIRAVDYGAGAGSGLFTSSRTSGKTAAPTQLAGGEGFTPMRKILDVNASSVILLDLVGSTYLRVPLPNGNGNDPPTAMNILTPPTTYATEDSNGFYWIDGDGNVNRCAPANCRNTTSVLASGLAADKDHAIWGFYQDATALYWSRTSTNQIMRVAK